MLITCYRCHRKINRPDDHNADYILLPDQKKTAILCPACYLPEDVLIWGIHAQAPGMARKSVLEVIKTFVKGIVHK